MTVAGTVIPAVGVAAMGGPGPHVVPVAWSCGRAQLPAGSCGGTLLPGRWWIASCGSARFPARVFATVGPNGHLARVYAGLGGIRAATDRGP